jgi:hypothetical protein
MPNLLSRIVDPWYPATAIGLEQGLASVVQLERVKGKACRLKRAASSGIGDSVIQPSFDEPNIQNAAQLAAVLKDLATSAGLKKWKSQKQRTLTPRLP